MRGEGRFRWKLDSTRGPVYSLTFNAWGRNYEGDEPKTVSKGLSGRRDGIDGGEYFKRRGFYGTCCSKNTGN